VCLADDGKLISSFVNESQKDHAAWIQVAIQKMMKEADVSLQKLDAVGVSIGPGSYTGLRIGLSTAKGICYALNIPLITEISLRIMAFSAIQYLSDSDPELLTSESLICPMIDARRLEVFTAIYASNMREIMQPCAYNLDVDSFEQELGRQKILFLGNGSVKFRQVCTNQNAIFKKIPLNPVAICGLTYKNFIGNNFADLTYTEPLYLKEFFTR
jgi:tRNA threonylcarbamoyladenosine biosynthesis protein TsaB